MLFSQLKDTLYLREFQDDPDLYDRFHFLFRLVDFKVMDGGWYEGSVQNFPKIGRVRWFATTGDFNDLLERYKKHEDIAAWVYCPKSQKHKVLYFAVEVEEHSTDSYSLRKLEKKTIITPPQGEDSQTRELYDKLVDAMEIKKGFAAVRKAFVK